MALPTFGATAGPSATLSPSAPFPECSGYRAYLAPPLSQRDEEGFSSCSTRPCHRAVASHPARVLRRISQAATLHTAFALRLRARPLGLRTFEATMRSLSLRPDDSLPTPRVELPMGFGVLVSRHPAIHATRLLTLASVGLPTPTERASLFWTHNRTCGFPASGSRTGLTPGHAQAAQDGSAGAGTPPAPRRPRPRKSASSPARGPCASAAKSAAHGRGRSDRPPGRP